MNYIDAINFITPYAKAMMKKKGYYLLLDNTLISLTEEQSQLAITVLPQNTDTVICQLKENIGDPSVPIDYRYYYMIHNMYVNYTQLSASTNPIINIENVQDIEELYNLLKLKSKQGAILYNWQNSIMLPFFSGIVPINKSDKMDITIYPFDNASNIIRYRVKKSKPKCIIDLYMRLMMV